MTRPTLNVIGCGRVGQTLARLFQARGACAVQDLLGRDQAQVGRAADFIRAGRVVGSLSDMRAADFWLVAVPDARIGSVGSDLAAALQAGRQRAGVAFHCSGYTPASALQPLRSLGFRIASAHPNLNFADPAAAVEQFNGTACGLEGDAAALDALRSLFQAVGGVCFEVATERKALYHAGAVMANNFAVVLQVLAREAWAAAGVPDDVAAKMHATLMRSTLQSVLSLGPRAITGPAARGDLGVVRAQGTAVFSWHPEAGVLYQEFSRLARRVALRRTTFPEESQEGL